MAKENIYRILSASALCGKKGTDELKKLQKQRLGKN